LYLSAQGLSRKAAFGAFLSIKFEKFSHTYYVKLS